MQEGHELTDDFEETALERAREYGRQLSPDHACAACARLDLQPPQDERLKEIAGWRIEDDGVPFFRQPPEPPTEEHHWFFAEGVMPAFREAFRENAADPEACDVCRDPDLTCEHEHHRPEGCPVDG
jgi:hypothetical protein